MLVAAKTVSLDSDHSPFDWALKRQTTLGEKLHRRQCKMGPAMGPAMIFAFTYYQALSGNPVTC